MYLLILGLPLLNVFISCFFGRCLGKLFVFYFIVMNLFLTFFISSFVFYEVAFFKYVCFVDLSSWISTGILKVNWLFLYDIVGVCMIFLVVFVSFLVHLYSIDYMGEDPHVIRFLGYLSLFTFFMLMLITAGNFLQLFLGWEGVGLSSYLLINFWYTRVQANKSAMKAVIVNRFGDFGIYFALLLCFLFFKTLDFSIVFNLAHFLKDDVISFLFFDVNKLSFICFFLFLGTVGKSAQMGLHTWLPDAMEGPTPVSALIHAATMVTAGVFVLIRCSPLLEYSSSILFLICLFGGLTAFFAGSVGMVQYDLKKVIAYSTCSQLGYMVFSCGISSYSVSLFHLFNHGFFKALLFLGAGSIIHALFDEQDMRKMGGLLNLLPLTYVAILIGSLALLGFPFLSGFYSKDVILEIIYVKYSINNFFIYWLGVLTAFITAFYSTRLIYLVFFAKTNSFFFKIKHSHESISFIAFVLFILGFFSIFIGFLFKEMFVGVGSDFWSNSIFVSYNNILLTDSEFLFYYIKIIPVFFSLFGVVCGFLLYNFFYKFTFFVIKHETLNNIYWFLSKKWYFDAIYNKILVYPLLSFFYYFTFKLIDRGLIEFFGPLSIVRFFNKLSYYFSIFQSGFIYHYIFIMLLGSIFLLFVVFINFGFGFFFNIYLNLFLCCLSIVLFLLLVRKSYI